ncbi:site-specific integrase [Chryseobacterium oryctis]|uniref:Site-specific integrase n=1 Tax=Chryseobacterium oryctis TaxID=2952618 RepID=A0ABT3HM23_9FLAO|nr:site-specific integrase [Chryseobacterium oryctis]MCW3160836.1 site-specific integrase [Chryseobacterium oryctis]
MNFDFSLSGNGINKNIDLCIIDNRFERLTISTQLGIPKAEWDYEKQRPYNIYRKKNKLLNKKLDTIKVILSEYIESTILQKKKVTSKKIEDIINIICFQNNFENSEDSLLFYIDQYISTRYGIICSSTYKRYKVFYNLIERFEGFLQSKIKIDKIDNNFAKEFLLFGRNESYSEATIFRTLKFIRTILNFIEKQGKATSIRNFEFKKEKQEKELITLNEEELLRIKNTKVPETLQSSKDWLLISCYTGQRISDFMNFSKDKLLEIEGKLCINFTQQKTGKNIFLPLHPIVLEIINKNNNNFPKPLSPHVYNRNIKKIGKIAHIDTKIKARKRIGHRVKNLNIEKWEALTSHIGRRSFATNFYGKIPTSLLINATGHGTEKMFLNYINPIDKDQILGLGRYFEQTYNPKTR